MKEMNFSELQQLILQNTAGIQALEQTIIAQEVQKVAGSSNNPDEVTMKDLARNMNALMLALQKAGFKKDEVKAIGKTYQEGAATSVRSGMIVSDKDLALFAARVVNEAVRNKNLTVTNKMASKNYIAKGIKEDYKKDVIRQEDSKGLKNVAEKIQYFLEGWRQDQDSKEPKQRKRFIDELLDGLSKNKGIMGVFTDIIKLVTLLGASWLRKFGTLGSVLGAALIIAGPTLAKALWDTISKGLSGLGLGGIAKGLGRALPWLGTIGAGFKAFDKFKQGDTVGGLAYTTSAIAFAIAPFLGPYGAIALARGGLSAVVGEYHEQIGAWIADYFPEVAEAFETLRSFFSDTLMPFLEKAFDKLGDWLTKKGEEAKKGFDEGLLEGKESDKNAPWSEKAANFLGRHPDAIEKAGKYLFPIMPALGAGLFVGGRVFHRNAEKYKEQQTGTGGMTPDFLPKGSVLQTNKYGYVSNLGKLNRETAWNSMMKWKETNPEEFNKRYEVIDANATYTDPKGRKFKGSQLVSFGSFENDLSNKKGKGQATEIIMGKGFMNYFMNEAVAYENQTGNKLLGEGRITSGMGTSKGHTTGGGAGQHDNPYGYTFDIGNNKYLQSFADFYKKIHSSAKVLVHGSGSGINGIHGHFGTDQDIISSLSTDSLIISKIEEKKKEEKKKEEKKPENKQEKPQTDYPLPPVPNVPPSPPQTALPDFPGNYKGSKVLNTPDVISFFSADSAYGRS